MQICKQPLCHRGTRVFPNDLCVSFSDCSLKVKDVLREFDADGRLAQHRHGEVRDCMSY